MLILVASSGQAESTDKWWNSEISICVVFNLLQYVILYYVVYRPTMCPHNMRAHANYSYTQLYGCTHHQPRVNYILKIAHTLKYLWETFWILHPLLRASPCTNKTSMECYIIFQYPYLFTTLTSSMAVMCQNLKFHH